jgi:hypothetical protein
MAAAAREVEPALRVADTFARVTTSVGMAALGAAVLTEVIFGGVMQGVLASESTSVGASQAINVATQIADGFLADAMGGVSANPVPVLAGAAGGAVHMAGQVGDDISRATSRASAVATTGSGGGSRAVAVARAAAQSLPTDVR